MAKVHVLSWNIFAGKDLPGVIEFLKKENPDFIALQEILAEEDGSKNQAKAIAQALGHHYLFESAHTLTPGDSYVLDYFNIERPMQWGNALLSKEPFVASQRHELSEDLGRVAVEGQVEVGGTLLRLFSTHLVGGPAKRHQTARLTQARSLAKLFPKEHAIIMGDFNEPPESPVISILNTVATSTEPTPPFVPTREGRKIDYIFTTADMQTCSHDTLASEASDHLPITAELSF